MALWLSIGVLFLCVTGLILRPVLRPVSGDSGALDDDSHLMVYKDQLEELAREKAKGGVSEDEANAMEAEIRRNLLSAARQSGGHSGSSLSPTLKTAAIFICAAIPAASFILYAQLGTPSLPDLPLADRDIAGQSQGPVPERMAQAIEALKKELEENPDNLDGWVALSRALTAADQVLEAVSALRNAVALAPDNIQIKGDLASTLTQASQGVVGQEATELFGEILQAEPGDPRARYFNGLITAQSGDLRGAIAIWRGLEADSPFDAPWMPAVQSSVQAAGEQLGIDPTSIKPQRVNIGRRAPSQEEIAAIEALSEQEREALVNSMVENLAVRMEEEPDNIEGWVRLIRSYGVLGRMDDAQTAFDKAKTASDWSEQNLDRLDKLANEIGLEK